MEDWYSEERVYGVDRGPYEALREKESYALKNCKFATTTSQVMASAIANRLGIAAPAVIYNSFPDSEFEDRNSGPTLSTKFRVAWFSQTVGPDRGLELLIDAASSVSDRVEIAIRGKVSDEYQRTLTSRAVSNGVNLRFLGPCEHQELLGWLSENDIGYAGELPLCGNKDLTISNKILQYMQAGLPVIATDTQGQIEVARSVPAAVFIFDHRSSDQLASLLVDLTGSKDRLEDLKKTARCDFEGNFAWSQSAETIRRLFSRALSQ
jgi:glycosyltransferase involved in cell wall biosynthesis